MGCSPNVAETFSQGEDGVLRYQYRLCVLDVDDLKRIILEEYHGSRYSIHTGATKKNRDLGGVYWLDCLKRDIVEFVARWPNCQ